MADCPGESETQHHLGADGGFGPVQNAEYVLFAVFEKTDHDGKSVTANSFENNQLKKGGQSVCRLSYIERSVFDKNVVRVGQNAKGALIGVASALVERIRAIRSKIVLETETDVQAFCVLDHVLATDYEAHATVNYGDGIPVGVSAGQKGKIRERAKLDLADVFSAITGVDDIQFVEPTAPTST